MRPVLITGGAGFIGANLAHRLLQGGQPVIVLDDLSRPSAARNVAWLTSAHDGGLIDVRAHDVRDAARVREAVRRARAVFHLAAQVAVTSSLADPVTDFEINARGTLNVLEAARALPDPPPVLLSSTNKVYGDLADARLRDAGARYEPVDEVLRRGVSERRPLDFRSPYGCSKGAADQYALDYARTFGLPAAVFRMSCVYGPRQLGTEDQGWVAHFMRCALRREPITIYGDGKQVRDLLFVDDLLDAFLSALGSLERVAGRAFNVGGGPARALSLLELLDHLRGAFGLTPAITFGAWRAGDQRYYVSDTGALGLATGWRPRTPVGEGLRRLYQWLSSERAPRAAAGAAP